MTRKFLCALFLPFLLYACSGGSNQNYRLHTLPSGKQIKILAMGQMNFSESDPALMLKYETDINLDDKAALRKEVDEIWEVLKVDVERANLKHAIISANQAPQGTFIKEGRGYNFLFEKTADGKWKALENK